MCDKADTDIRIKRTFDNNLEHLFRIIDAEMVLKVMIRDKLSSHFDSEVLILCQKYSILFKCLPSNSTHLVQPLDIAYFAPMKNYWRDILRKWKKKEECYLPALMKQFFLQLLKRLHHWKLKMEVHKILFLGLKSVWNISPGCWKTNTAYSS